MLSYLGGMFSKMLGCEFLAESKHVHVAQEKKVTEISTPLLEDASWPIPSSKKRKFTEEIGPTLPPSKKIKLADNDKKRFLQSYDIQDYFIWLSTFNPIQIAEVPKQANLNCVETQLEESDFRLNQPFFLNIAEVHWTLLYIDHTEGKLEYYDSLKDFGRHSKLLCHLEEIAEKLSAKTGKKYQVLNKITRKIQEDDYQCGVWVTHFLEKRLEDPSFDFNSLAEKPPEFIKNQRKKLFNRLQDIEEKRAEVNKKELDSFMEFYGERSLAKAAIRARLQSIPRMQRISDILIGHPVTPIQQTM